MAEIEIRPANSGDIKELMALDHSCETTHVWQMDSSTEMGQTSIQFREIRLPRAMRIEYPHKPEQLPDTWTRHSLFLVARNKGSLAGYLTLDINPEFNSAKVTNLVVSENQRRQGIGSALVVSAQSWLKARKVRRLSLECVSKNYAAISMAHKLHYEFNGFEDNYFSNRDIALFFSTQLK